MDINEDQMSEIEQGSGNTGMPCRVFWIARMPWEKQHFQLLRVAFFGLDPDDLIGGRDKLPKKNRGRPLRSGSTPGERGWPRESSKMLTEMVSALTRVVGRFRKGEI
jgi:hypothetical protein